jgi:DNA-binding CsgD family transcriptional regulator
VAPPALTRDEYAPFTIKIGSVGLRSTSMTRYGRCRSDGSPPSLPFAEIAAEMSLSRNTISSQAMSIYRKLGAGSRSQAIARSRELGLLEG